MHGLQEGHRDHNRPGNLHQKSTVLRRKYGAFLFSEADFWGAALLRLHPFQAFGECADYILKICILQYVKESLENHSKKCSKQKLNAIILT